LRRDGGIVYSDDSHATFPEHDGMGCDGWAAWN